MVRGTLEWLLLATGTGTLGSRYWLQLLLLLLLLGTGLVSRLLLWYGHGGTGTGTGTRPRPPRFEARRTLWSGRCRWWWPLPLLLGAAWYRAAGWCLAWLGCCWVARCRGWKRWSGEASRRPYRYLQRCLPVPVVCCLDPATTGAAGWPLTVSTMLLLLGSGHGTGTGTATATGTGTGTGVRRHQPVTLLLLLPTGRRPLDCRHRVSLDESPRQRFGSHAMMMTNHCGIRGVRTVAAACVAHHGAVAAKQQCP